jgi:plastocyanin
MNARPTAAPAPAMPRTPVAPARRAALLAIAVAGLAGLGARHLASPAKAQGEETVVEYRSDGLTMRAVAVPPGGRVRWVNRDAVAHNTTHLPPAGEPSRWNSYEIPPGGSYTQDFPVIGAFRYFDFYDPDDPTLTGVVIVTTGEMPDTPTPLPTPTIGPTETPPQPTPTRTPTPTASPAPQVFRGNLTAYSGICVADALLTICGTGAPLPLIAGYDLSAYFGLDVQVEGVQATCPVTGGGVVLISSIHALPSGCSGATATPEPTPTPVVTDNLARDRNARASTETQGHVATNLTDARLETTWEAIGEAAWAYVDLGAATTFNQVVLRWAAYPATRYGLYVWHEGRGEWTGLYWTDEGRGGVEAVSLRTTYARYVLVYAVDATVAGRYELAEFEVYGREQPNLALGSAVAGSAGQECCPPWYAVDGDFRTGWASVRGNPTPWLRVHLPELTDITEVRLYWDHFAFPTAYSLVFYEGGEGRQLIVPSAPPGLNRFEFSWPMRADTVLIYSHQLSALGFVALAECELYGPPVIALGGPSPASGGRLAGGKHGQLPEVHLAGVGADAAPYWAGTGGGAGPFAIPDLSRP